MWLNVHMHVMMDDNTQSLAAIAESAQQNCYCYATRKLARKVTRAYDQALSAVGLRGTQYTLLAAAAVSEGELTLTELAARLGMDRTTLSRNIAPLVRDRLLDQVDDKKGRASGIRLSLSGKEKLKAAFPVWSEVQASMRAEIGLIPHLSSL